MTLSARGFELLRAGDLLGPVLSAGEVAGVNAIVAAMSGTRRSWKAYALGTAWLETAGSMQPIKEMGGEKYFHRMYDIGGARPAKARELGNLKPGDGARYCGRGYPQLTGYANYLKADQKLGLKGALVANPDLAMRPDLAALIMRLGMVEGWFTGKKLGDYLPAETATFAQFKPARRIINGMDRADEIAAAAVQFQAALAA